MNSKQQVLAVVVAAWLVLSFVNAVRWQTASPIVRWEWRSTGLFGGPGSLGRFLLLAVPGLVVSIPLWKILGGATAGEVARWVTRPVLPAPATLVWAVAALIPFLLSLLDPYSFAFRWYGVEEIRQLSRPEARAAGIRVGAVLSAVLATLVVLQRVLKKRSH